MADKSVAVCEVVLACKLKHFRLVVRDVESHVPLPVLRVDDAGVELEFYTSVAQRTDVGSHRVEA